MTGGHKALERSQKPSAKGIYAALASAFFLGAAPIFGRQAILLGMDPLAVVAVRTILAALLLLGIMFIFFRPFLFIYPAGLIGCLVAGFINGVGSLFFYSSLGRIPAGLGQLLYSLYPLFLIFWLTLDKQPPSRLTILRVLIALPAIILLVQVDSGGIDMIGVIQMLIASALYALHLPINQRVLYDMPAPTVTVYTLLAMSAVVVPVYLFSGAMDFQGSFEIGSMQEYWRPVLGLTLVTFFSRITLFIGIKHLGGMQTAILGLSELLVTIFLAYLWLGERLSPQQWLGAILLIFSLMLVGFEPLPKKQRSGGFLSWMIPAGIPTDTWRPHD